MNPQTRLRGLGVAGAAVISGCLVAPNITPGRGISLLPVGAQATVDPGQPQPGSPTVLPTVIWTTDPSGNPIAIPTTFPTTLPTAGPPSLQGIDPDNGGPGATVTLSGTNLGATQGGDFQVYFQSANAVGPARESDTRIRVAVPAGATTGNVTAWISGYATNAVTFRVLKTLTLDRGDTELRVGDSVQYGASATDTGDQPVSPPAVAWSVAGGSGATVTAGKVTATAPGDVTIRVASGNLALTRSVHCYEVTGVSLDQSALTLNAMPAAGTPDPRFKVGERLVATVQASDGTTRKVNWTTSDEARVTVDAAGWVQTVRDAATGSAVITATAENDSRFLATASVTVTKNSRAEIGIY